LKILCIDDDFAYRRYFYHLLSERYEVTFASTGQEGIQLSSDERFDIVFIDAALPDMASDEACEIFRDDTFYQHTPIIFLSQDYSANELERFMGCGGDDYFCKSSTPNELKALMEVALSDVA